MTSQLARPALRRNARWWFLGPLEGKIWLGHHLGPMGFFGTQNPSCCLVTKKHGETTKAPQTKRPPFFLLIQGVVWELAEALSVFAIGLPTIYVNVLKQDFGEFSSCMILKGERVILPRRCRKIMTTQDGYNLCTELVRVFAMPSAYPTIIYSCFFRLQRSGWCRSVEFSQLYISLSVYAHT